MDFDDSPEEAEYRAHVRGLLEQHADELLHVAPGESIDPATHQAEFRATERVLAEAGLIGIPWPREHGGQGGTLVQQAIAGQEFARARIPTLINHIGIGMCGPDGHRARQRRPEGALPRPAAARRRRLVPAVQRTGVRAPTSRRCAPPPSATATTGSSTARRSGRRSPTSPTTASCSPAPTPTGPSTRASRCSSSTCTRPASPCGRCARWPAARASTRSSSTTSASPTASGSASRARAGGSRSPR